MQCRVEIGTFKAASYERYFKKTSLQVATPAFCFFSLGFGFVFILLIIKLRLYIRPTFWNKTPDTFKRTKNLNTFKLNNLKKYFLSELKNCNNSF